MPRNVEQAVINTIFLNEAKLERVLADRQKMPPAAASQFTLPPLTGQCRDWPLAPRTLHTLNLNQT